MPAHPLKRLARNRLLLLLVRDAFRAAQEKYVEAASLLRAGEGKRFYTAVSPRFTWAQHYELSYRDHLAMAVIALGLASPLSVVARRIRAGKLFAIWSLFKADGEPAEGVSPDLVFGLAISLKYSLISCLQQGISLNKLVSQVRNKQRDKLFDVIRIDPSAVANPTIAYEIAKATLAQDEIFLAKLGGVIKDNAEVELRKLAELDLMLMVVDGLGGLEGMSAKQQQELFIRDLQLYKVKDDGSTRSLSTYIARWRKDHATNLREEMSSPDEV